jgi:outer membrane biosynthesis protein TonB
MNKVIRTVLSLVVSVMLFGALTMAQTSANNADKDKNKEHHSRLSKVAFWRHHNDADKKAKPVAAPQASPKPAQAKIVQPKTSQVKTAQPKTAQVKPVSTKQVAHKSDQKPQQHASNMSKPAVKKATAANKTKPQHKAQDPKSASVKQ